MSTFQPSRNTVSGPMTGSNGISPLGTGANSVQVGDGAIAATGASSIAIGSAASATSTDSIAIGEGAQSTADGTVAIGDNAQAKAGANNIAIGDNSKADHASGYAVALGWSADAGGVSSIAIGSAANASAAEAIAIGPETTTATDAASVALGAYADATGEEAIAIGKTTQATANDAIAMGQDAAASNTDTVAIGRATVASQPNAIAIGVAAKGQNSNTVAIRYGANAIKANSLAIGSGSYVAETNTTIFGSSTQVMKLYVTGNIQASDNLIVGNAAADYHQVTGTLDVSTLTSTSTETVGGTAGGVNISSTKLITFIDDSDNSSGQTTFALADGHPGQIKMITYKVSSSAGATAVPTLGATNIEGLSSGIQFGAAGDGVTLMFNGTKWAIVGNYGATISQLLLSYLNYGVLYLLPTIYLRQIVFRRV